MRRTHPGAWLLALGLSATGAALWWGWAEVSTTARECATGSGGSSASGFVFAGLVLLMPAGVGAYASRSSRARWREVAVVAVIGTVIAVGAVALASVLWWSSHNCMT